MAWVAEREMAITRVLFMNMTYLAIRAEPARSSSASCEAAVHGKSWRREGSRVTNVEDAS
jgi:hypothetical protein